MGSFWNNAIIYFAIDRRIWNDRQQKEGNSKIDCTVAMLYVAILIVILLVIYIFIVGNKFQLLSNLHVHDCYLAFQISF